MNTPKFRYYIIGEDYCVTGTNDQLVAQAAATTGFDCDVVMAVIDTQENKDLTYSATLVIPEDTTYVL